MAHIAGLRYLLDTNRLSARIRQPQGTVAATLAGRGYGTVCTSIVVTAELRFGARKPASKTLTGKVDDLLASLPVLPLDAGADRTYAEIRLQWERPGTSIRPNDLLIAAHALKSGLILVTDNVDEFGRVAGLQVESSVHRPASEPFQKNGAQRLAVRPYSLPGETTKAQESR